MTLVWAAPLPPSLSHTVPHTHPPGNRPQWLWHLDINLIILFHRLEMTNYSQVVPISDFIAFDGRGWSINSCCLLIQLATKRTVHINFIP